MERRAADRSRLLFEVVVWSVSTLVAVVLAYSALDKRISVLESDRDRLERIERKVDELREIMPLIADHMERDRAIHAKENPR